MSPLKEVYRLLQLIATLPKLAGWKMCPAGLEPATLSLAETCSKPAELRAHSQQYNVQVQKRTSPKKYDFSDSG